jgi:hypothetical protein
MSLCDNKKFLNNFKVWDGTLRQICATERVVVGEKGSERSKTRVILDYARPSRRKPAITEKKNTP